MKNQFFLILLFIILFSGCSQQKSLVNFKQIAPVFETPEHSGRFSISMHSPEGNLFFGGSYLFIAPDSAWMQIRDWLGRKLMWIQFSRGEYTLWLQREGKVYNGKNEGLLIGESFLPVFSERLLFEIIFGIPSQRNFLYTDDRKTYINSVTGVRYRLSDSGRIIEEWEEGKPDRPEYRVLFTGYEQWKTWSLPEEVIITVPKENIELKLKVDARSEDVSDFKPLKLPKRLLN